MPTGPQSNPVARVRAYYERNTPIFMRFGRERETQTIHRSVWAESVGATSPIIVSNINNISCLTKCLPQKELSLFLLSALLKKA